MKKYTNLVILGLLIIAAAVYLVIKNVNFNEVFLNVGYYDSKISIANTADVHGHIVYDDDVGGYYTTDDVSVIMGLPLVKHYVDNQKAKNGDVLFLDSGDMFHGTNEANIEKGKGVVDVVNLMGYNAMVPGNHDFNFGFDRLLEIRSQLKFPILCANIYKDGKLAFEEYKIFEINGKKVGVFGLTTPSALMYTNSRDNNGVTIDDPVKCAQRVMSELKGKTDVVVLLSHLGDYFDEELVNKVDGIDLVLCGHYHKLYKSAIKVKNSYLVESGGWTTHVGFVDLYLKDGKVAHVDWNTLTTKEKDKVDKNIDTVAQKYHVIAQENAKEVMGKAAVKLNAIRSQVRSKETNLANLLTDAMRENGNADLTLMNGGGIRESMPAGDIDLYKIGKVLPFSNSLVVIELKGDTIYTAIERGLNSYPSGMNGGFLQVSGINYVFDGSKPAGKRLVSITKDGKPLDKNASYKVATNDYLHNGGDGYEELKNAKLLSMGGLLKDVLAQYIKSKGQVSPAEEGRVKVINERYK